MAQRAKPKLFWNEEHRWWCDYSGATLYGTKEMAEVAAFSAVTHDSSLVGCVQVEQVIGAAGRGS